jgi:acetyltransferase-like isoleucine patch superfamily enzyme
MRHKISILYSWFIRSVFFFLPDYPLFMRLRGWFYSLFMKSCGKNFQISSSATLNSLAGLVFGDNVYIAYNTVLIGVSLHIQNDVIIGPNSLISGSDHVFDGDSFRRTASRQSKVLIEKGSWVGGNCSITSGSILPSQSILAAGSVLTKKFTESKTIYGGIPAIKIKKINEIN